MKWRRDFDNVVICYKSVSSEKKSEGDHQSPYELANIMILSDFMYFGFGRKLLLENNGMSFVCPGKSPYIDDPSSLPTLDNPLICII